jgi:Flp pilus assembly protein TadD
MIKRFRLFLGPERSTALFLLLALTGLGNLLLNVIVDKQDWARPAQSILVLTFFAGTAVIVGSKLDAHDRGRWMGILAPVFGAILLGIIAVPNLLPLILGGSVGWIAAGIFIFRPRGPMEYQQAVKHLRKNRYEDAVHALDRLIKNDPKEPNHYRFRAEILRIWGKLDRAQRDYEKMTKLAPNSPVAYNGLAEVHLQAEQYEKALEAARTAFDLAPNEWVAAYNLGMIEDRLHESEQAIEHLKLALDAKVPDSRHRLLIYLYLARAYARLGKIDEAQEAAHQLQRLRGGLNEWQVILQSDQADTLRDVIADDITTAEALAIGEITVETLAK